MKQLLHSLLCISLCFTASLQGMETRSKKRKRLEEEQLATSRSAQIQLAYEKNRRGQILLEFAMRGNEDAVLRQIGAGADLNKVDLEEWSALHWASTHGDVSIVAALLVAGAEVDCQTIEGNTPLHLAVFNDHVAVVKLLVANGANVHAVNKLDETPLQLANLSRKLNSRTIFNVLKGL